MEKFFSPLIISDALDEVVEWSAKQKETSTGGGGGGADAQEITVKVSKSAREITAGYPVDDDAATIALRVPNSYPLEPVDVVSVKRVAVKEEKWQAWLMGTKAVIMLGVSFSLFILSLLSLLANVSHTELQPRRRLDCLPALHLARPQGPGGVCHLLLHHRPGQDPAGQTLRDVQSFLPPCVLVQVVSEQRPQHVPAVPERH